MNLRKIITNLDDDEDVIALYRECFLAFFWNWFFGFAILLSPFFFLFLFIRWGAWGSLLLLGLFVFGLLIIFKTWRLWYFSFIAMTNKRVIMIKQNGILDRSVSQVDLDKIYDVSYRHKGILQTIFNVGSLYITPGDFEKVELKNMDRPAEIQSKILKLQKEYGLEPKSLKDDSEFEEKASVEEKEKEIENFFRKQ